MVGKVGARRRTSRASAARTAVGGALVLALSVLGVPAFAAPMTDGAQDAPTSPEADPTASQTPPESQAPADVPEDVTPSDIPPARADVVKTNSLGGEPLLPGDEFVYTLTASCSGLKAGCVDLVLTDTLPEGLDVTSLPQSTSLRTVTYDEATRLLTITFTEALVNPAGTTGLPDGATRNVQIGMRLPAETTYADGAVITNTADVDGVNVEPASDSSDVTVAIERVVRPVATKSWDDGAAVAGSGEASVITLGVRNASSSSAEVTELVVTDASAETFEHHDLVGARATAWPAGADRAVLEVCTAAGSACTDGDYVAGPATGELGELALRAGVAAGDVTGVRVRFLASDGSLLPYDATGGAVELDLVLRETSRSDGETIAPTDTLNLSNCATPSAVDAEAGTVDGAAACAGYQILPDTISLQTGKEFFADGGGDFSRQGDEYAVVGHDSGVSALVTARNTSPFPIAEVTITEPAPGSASELDKVDVRTVRLDLPAGATQARFVVTYDDGSTFEQTYTENQPGLDVARDGARVTSVQVTYRGTGDDGAPTIEIGATARLGIHGVLDGATAEDLPGGTSPGVTNCAAYSAPSQGNGTTGSASGTACADLAVEAPREGGPGVKTPSQTSVPEGQPFTYRITVPNTGNLPMRSPVVTDPKVDGDDVPVADDNPFTQLRLVGAEVTGGAAGDVQLLVFDPDALSAPGSWVPFDPTDAALLDRATGVRAAKAGDLRPGQRFDVVITVERRDGVPNGTPVTNCFQLSTTGSDAASACGSTVTTGPVNSSASINKSIAPDTLPVWIPGLEQQVTTVRLTAQNNGNINAGSLVVTDADADFFDAVDLVALRPVTLPAGAGSYRVDAFVDGEWVLGTASTQTGSPQLPDGVAAGDVRGLRITFLGKPEVNEGFSILPAPISGNRQGVFEFRVTPRQSLASDPGTPVPADLENTVGGEFTTNVTTTPQEVPSASDDLHLVPGTPELDLVKTPDSAISPGEVAPFSLRVTNTGTADVPNLTVVDPLPAGLELDTSFAGDGGQPFRITNAAVPEGTEPVPTPQLTLSSDPSGRVTALRLDFGDWLLRPGATFTVEIQVRLAPGVSAGDVIVNTAGATSPVEGLECAASSGDLLGDGTTYCTDSAEVTTLAGAAFQARKWVAGTPELGWYDTRTGAHVPAGDASCPARTEDGVAYTLYPCVALVNPGDDYDYLIQLTNAGTEPATAMRLVDRLPVQGDRGVILDSERGTEWDARPVLASEPVVRGDNPGAFSVGYTTSDTLCTDDLAMGGAGSSAATCPDGTWGAPFGADVTAFLASSTWPADAPLDPGGEILVAFSMTTPDAVTHVSDPTIAWNSFAHAETTLRDGGPHVLPATEPIQVGVATAYGTLEIVKEVTENPAGLPLEGVEFGVAYECTATPVGHSERVVAQGAARLTAGGAPFAVTGLPAGATCRVWETDARGAVSGAPEDAPVVVDIAPELGAAAQATVASIDNAYPLGQLVVVKHLDGAGAALGTGPFEFAVECTFDGQRVYSGSVTLAGDGTTTPLVSDPVTGVPVGAECVVSETENGGADLTPDPRTVTITPADAGDDGVYEVRVDVTNTFSAGTVQVVKLLDGAGADLHAGETFRVLVVCEATADGSAGAQLFSGEVEVRAGEPTSVTTADGEPLLLPVGAACWGTETDPGAAVAHAVDHGSRADAVVVAPASSDELDVVTITATNTFDVPPPTAEVPPPSVDGPPAVAGPLPGTGVGSDVLRILAVAMALVLLGRALLVLRRRSRDA